MSKAQIVRNEHRSVLCRYWNGAIGSTTIQVLVGGNVFTYDNTEKHLCFKIGIGIETVAIKECPYFRQRYED